MFHSTFLGFKITKYDSIAYDVLHYFVATLVLQNVVACNLIMRALMIQPINKESLALLKQGTTYLIYAD